MAVGISPIERQRCVFESAVRVQLYILELAEIVRVELDQVVDYRHLFSCGGYHFDLGRTRHTSDRIAHVDIRPKRVYAYVGCLPEDRIAIKRPCCKARWIF